MNRSGRAPALIGLAILFAGIPVYMAYVTADISRLHVPQPTLVVVDRYSGFICEIRDGDRTAEAGYWPVDPVPPRIAATLLTIEDRRFNRHPGVDPLAVIRAIRQNRGHRSRISGASTLAMQVARLQRPSERIYRNKGREMLTALAITFRYGRSAVMDHYLRMAPYGNGIRGIGYAAYCYLGKPVDDLSWAEIAFLSSIPQQPNRLNPRTGSGRTSLVRRARRIINMVHEAGYMSDAEAVRALDQIADITIQPRLSQPKECVHLALRYREMLSSENIRETLKNPVVRTDIDLDLQKNILRQTRLCVDAWAVSGVNNAAVMVLDASTGAVVSLIGSTDYFDRDRAGAIDYTSVKRSPGSTLKPFIYALAMETGVISPNSNVMDSVTHARGFRNFDGVWLGDVSVDRALASSRNVPAVDVLRQTGVHQVYGHFSELRLHTYETDVQRYGHGLAVGGLPVTMESLVRAYDVFSSRGLLRDLRWYHGQRGTSAGRMFSVSTVQWINRSLSDPMARLPGFPRMGHLEYSYPAAVKTGTSEGHRDAWTVAWSPDYMVAVWLGRHDGKPMNHAGGYRTAAELARVIMDMLHNDGKTPVTVDADWALAPKQSGAGSLSMKDSINDVTCDPSGRSDATANERIQITSPEQDAVYYIDPETPPEFASILFAVATNIREGQITWEVNGVPFISVSAPFTAQWRMIPGAYEVRAVSPTKGVSSSSVRFQVMAISTTGTGRA